MLDSLNVESPNDDSPNVDWWHVDSPKTDSPYADSLKDCLKDYSLNADSPNSVSPNAVHFNKYITNVTCMKANTALNMVYNSLIHNNLLLTYERGKPCTHFYVQMQCTN